MTTYPVRQPPPRARPARRRRAHFAPQLLWRIREGHTVRILTRSPLSVLFSERHADVFQGHEAIKALCPIVRACRANA